MADIATIGLKVDSTGVVKATKDLDRMGKEGGKTTKSIKSLGSAFTVLAGALGAGALFRGVIQATVEQERVTAQLDQTLRSTGRYTPELSQQMQDYATSLQQVTTFGDEALIGAQAMLLTFTQIGGETFPRAQEAILDVATAMGTDLRAATIQVGKALNDPIKGVTALAESGIQFTDAQRDMIKEMVETNRVAEAQSLILKELEVQFGGSARAARDTLGGSLASLKNAFGDLLEGDAGGEGVKGATQAINDLTKQLGSSEVKDAFAAITTAVLKMASAAATGATKFVEFGTFIGEGIARLQGYEDTADRVVRLQKELNEELSKPENSRSIANRRDESRIAALRAELKLYEQLNSVSSEAIATPNVPTLGGGEESKLLEDPFGDTLKFTPRDEVTERNLILERYNELLKESDRIAESVKSPQELFNEEIMLLNELRETVNITTGEKLLSQEQYEAAVIESQERMASATDETTGKMTEFAQQAARNMQDAFADGFFDLFTGKTSDLAETFSNMLQRMASDLAASAVLDFLVGDLAGTGKVGGIIGDAIGSFGGFRANGGPVSPGKSFIVGERGPELFTPKSSGQIIPNGAAIGGGVSVTVNVDATGSSAEGDDEQSNQLGRLIGASVRSVLIEERRPGGLLG